MRKHRLISYFESYESHHQTRGNQICHYLGVPMIVLSILGLLSQVQFANFIFSSELLRLDLAVIIWAIALFWYFLLDWKIAAPFGLILLSVYFLGRAIPGPALWVFFVLGWIFQLVGHFYFEKKSPAFIQNFLHLLIGPLWLFSLAAGYPDRNRYRQ